MLRFPKLCFEDLRIRKGLRRPRTNAFVSVDSRDSRKQNASGPCPFNAYSYFLKSSNFIMNSNIFFLASFVEYKRAHNSQLCGSMSFHKLNPLV